MKYNPEVTVFRPSQTYDYTLETAPIPFENTKALYAVAELMVREGAAGSVNEDSSISARISDAQGTLEADIRHGAGLWAVYYHDAARRALNVKSSAQAAVMITDDQKLLGRLIGRRPECRVEHAFSSPHSLINVQKNALAAGLYVALGHVSPDRLVIYHQPSQNSDQEYPWFARQVIKLIGSTGKIDVSAVRDPEPKPAIPTRDEERNRLEKDHPWLKKYKVKTY